MGLISVAKASDSWTNLPMTNGKGPTRTVLLTDNSVSGSADPIWYIDTQSFYDLDTGVRYLRVTHILDLLIASDETIKFDLSFGTSYDPWVDPKGVMVDDSGQCTVTQSTTDTRFWTQTAADYYYTCNNYACTNSASLTKFRSALASDYSASQDSQNDWTTPLIDNDPKKPFCQAL